MSKTDITLVSNSSNHPLVLRISLEKKENFPNFVINIFQDKFRKKENLPNL